MKFLNFSINAFPLWILIGSLLALVKPSVFTWFRGPLITLGLGMIMLGMGVTLTLEDFKRVIKFPKWIGLGVFFQYLIMPSLGWGLGYLFNLPTPFAVGLILVSCCPGGTASNVITFLAKANVALSVSMTAISTMLAVLMTPLLTTFLAGNRVDVDTLGLLIKTFQVVIVPVTMGVLINRYFHKKIERILPAAPLVAVVFIVLIVSSIIGAGKEKIMDAGLRLIGAVFSLHTLGFLLGYVFSRLILKKEVPARTVAIEVGMQNSGLGVVLARNNFVNPLVAIPSAISSVFHSLIGSVLAAFWRKSKRDIWE